MLLAVALHGTKPAHSELKEVVLIIKPVSNKVYKKGNH